MSYNYWLEKKKWDQWKNSEEKQLRDLGVSEEIIERLREYDWKVFKEERNYQTKLISKAFSLDNIYLEAVNLPVHNVESFLEDMENTELFHILRKENRVTLQILFYKLEGYTSKEISKILGLKKSAVDKRYLRLKKKLSTFLF